MKNIILLLAFLCSSVVFSQEYIELPLVSSDEIEGLIQQYSGNEKKGLYLKDTENVLKKYKGTWEGNLEGKKFTIKLKKDLDVSPNSDGLLPFKQDILLMKLKIQSMEDNSLIFNSFNNATKDLFKGKEYSNAYEVDGKLVHKDPYYYIIELKHTTENNCAYTGYFKLTISDNSNEMKMEIFSNPSDFSDTCLMGNPFITSLPVLLEKK